MKNAETIITNTANTHLEDLPYALSAKQNGQILLRAAQAVAPETRRLDLIAQVGKSLLDSLDRPLSIAEIRHTEGVLSWLRDEYKNERQSEQYQAAIADVVVRGRAAQARARANPLTPVDRW